MLNNVKYYSYITKKVKFEYITLKNRKMKTNFDVISKDQKIDKFFFIEEYNTFGFIKNNTVYIQWVLGTYMTKDEFKKENFNRQITQKGINDRIKIYDVISRKYNLIE